MQQVCEVLQEVAFLEAPLFERRQRLAASRWDQVASCLQVHREPLSCSGTKQSLQTEPACKMLWKRCGIQLPLCVEQFQPMYSAGLAS